MKELHQPYGHKAFNLALVSPDPSEGRRSALQWVWPWAKWRRTLAVVSFLVSNEALHSPIQPYSDVRGDVWIRRICGEKG
jgi:hypothetical protein